MSRKRALVQHRLDTAPPFNSRWRKLTPTKIAQMRLRRERGESYRRIASRFGVHPKTVMNALEGDHV